MADGSHNHIETETTCAFGRYCIRHGFVHGFEAEELRRGLERLIRDCDEDEKVTTYELQRLLDDIDARDSLACLELEHLDSEEQEALLEEAPALEEVERLAVAHALRVTKGVKAEAARRLGIDRKTFYRKLRAFGLLEQKEGSATPKESRVEEPSGAV